MYRHMFYNDYRYFTPRYTEGSMRYTQKEMKAPGFFKTLPDFLQKRPSAFIKHCRWRTRYRDEIGDIVKIADGSFKVQSLTDTDEYYQVTLGHSPGVDPSCDCPDWSKKGWPCKHVLAILMHYEGDSGSDTSDTDDDDDNKDGVKIEAGQQVKIEPGCRAIKGVKIEPGRGAKNGVKIEAGQQVKLEPGCGAIRGVKSEAGQKVKIEPGHGATNGVKIEVGQQVKIEPGCRAVKGVKVEAIETGFNSLKGRQVKIEPGCGAVEVVKIEAGKHGLNYLQGQQVKIEPGCGDNRHVKIEPGCGEGQQVKIEPGWGALKGVKNEADETLLNYLPAQRIKIEPDCVALDGGPPEKKSRPQDVGTSVRRSTRANRGIKKAPLYE